MEGETGVNMIPERAAVQSDDLISAVDPPHMIFDDAGHLHPPKHEVWTTISERVGSRMSPKYVWVCFNENRLRGVTEKVRKKANLPPIEKRAREAEESDVDEPDENVSQDDVVMPTKTFMITVPPDTWNLIKPRRRESARADRPGKVRVTYVLNPDVWAPEITNLMWEQHQIPCPFVFKRAHVNITPTLDQKFVTLEDGLCKECNATAKGYIENEPDDDQPARLVIIATDTRGKRHTTKRQCRGHERERVGGEVEHRKVSEYHKTEGAKKVSNGVSAPNYYTPSVLRKVKQQKKDKTIGILNSDVFTNLQNMKYTHPYLGSIQKIGLDPLMVMYNTPSQLLINNTICSLGYNRFSIDSTGSLVQRIRRQCGLSSHIFLYQVIGHTGVQQVPLNQMLSERQDACTIAFWLNDSIRRKYQTPNEFVCDESPALISALSRSFARCTSASSYKAQCFDYLTKKSKDLPKCFIRTDLAHFINKARKWDIWLHLSHKGVKDHYMRWLGLLILAESLEEFEEILSHVLVLAYSTNIGLDDDGEKNAAAKSKEFLVNLVSGNTTVKDMMKGNIEPKNEDEDKDVSKDTQEGRPNEEEENTPENVKVWLKTIQERVIQMVEEENEHDDDEEEEEENDGGKRNPSAYHNKTLFNKFQSLSQDFMMWSAVMVKPFRSPYLTGSSAGVEGYFGDLKTNIFNELTVPLDKFVAKHLNIISGHVADASTSTPEVVNVVATGENQENTRDENNNTSDSDEELNQKEDWRGKSSCDGKRKSKYLSIHPEIKLTSELNILEEPKQLLLKNGNCLNKPHEMDDGSKLFVRNTCSYDSILQVIAVGIIDYDPFRKCVEPMKVDSPALQVAWSLAHTGAEDETYRLRTVSALAVSELTKCDTIRAGRSAKNRRTKTIQQYDMYGTVTGVVKNLQVLPSQETLWKCPEGHEEKETVSLVQVCYTTLRSQGIGNLHLAIIENLCNLRKNCKTVDCSERAEGDGKLRNHILIDLGMLQRPSKEKNEYMFLCSLDAVPKTMKLHDKEYRFVGLVAAKPGHFIAYAKRLRGCFEEYDDIAKHPYPAKENTKVTPQVLLYIATGSVN